MEDQIKTINRGAVPFFVIVNGQESRNFWKQRTIRPDIVVKKGNSTVIIDTKWKNTSKDRVAIEDLRQMYAYNNYWGANLSVLLYPSKNIESEFYSGNYYKNRGQNEDQTSSCRIQYLNIIGENGLKPGLAKDFLSTLQF